MADRYWIGPGVWDTSTGTKWAATSGGAGGASAPTSADNVFFDANSGTANVIVGNGTSAVCNSLDCTGYTGGLTDSGSGSLTVHGSFKLASGMTFTYDITLTFAATTSVTITTAGKTLAGNVTFDGSGGTWTLQDNFTSTGNRLTLTRGTLDANGYNVTINRLESSNTNTRTLALGSGTWNITANDGGASPYAWDINQSSGMTITGSATINMSCSSGTQRFYGGGKTYPTLNCGATGPGSHGVYIYGSNTFTNISASGSVATSLYFDTFTTQTVSNFTYSGSSGITRYLNAVSPPASLSKSGGSISVQYLSISGVSGTGGCIWFAYPINGNSVSGGATGWVTTGGGTFIDMLT